VSSSSELDTTAAVCFRFYPEETRNAKRFLHIVPSTGSSSQMLPYTGQKDAMALHNQSRPKGETRLVKKAQDKILEDDTASAALKNGPSLRLPFRNLI
jgi:hypothetical protein